MKHSITKQQKNNRFRRSGENGVRRESTGKNERTISWQWLKKDTAALAGTVVLILIAAWYVGFHSGRFEMNNITIGETRFIQQDQIQNAIHGFSDSTFLGFIKRNTFWTLRADALEQSLASSLSTTVAFEEVSVEKKFPNSLSIYIKERIPSVTWITNKSGTEHVYTVDRDGVVTQILQSREQADPSFPVIVDNNRDAFEIGWQVVSADYINEMLSIQEQFENHTGFAVDSYEFPTIECTERQYVAEKIFEQELSNEDAPEELKEKQRQIQARFQAGEITVDESLTELEQLKKEYQQAPVEGQEGSTDAEDKNTDNSGVDRIEWEKVYVPKECDFVKVAHEIHVKTKPDQAGFVVYMDMQSDPVVQMNNVRTIIERSVDDVKAIQYIDVRIPDRVYIK